MDILAVIACLLIACKKSSVLCDEGTDRYISYRGFGDLVLACNGSDVINITGVNLTNHATRCQHKTCTLSSNDSLLIENCNDNSTCTLPVHNMSGCITEKGFYKVRYSCKTKALTCDFDNNNCHIQENNNAWKVDKASTLGNDYRDFTTGENYGRLLFIKDGKSDETKIYNQVYSNPIQCLSFYYWGNGLGSLTVKRERKNGSIDTVSQFPNANNDWERFMRNLTDIGDYYLRFKATGDSSSQILIDNITILNADCGESRDRILNDQACRKLNGITKLQGCSKYFIEDVTSHFDRLEERCRAFVNNPKQICNEFGDFIRCDLRTVVRSNPSCFNLNTLMINYTCTEKAEVFIGKAEEMKNDPINIGLVAGAASGVMLLFVIFAVPFIVCRRRRNTEQRGKRTNPSLTSGGGISGYLPSNRPEDGLSNNPLYVQSLATTSKQSHSKPGNYNKGAEVYGNNQNLYSLASDVNQPQDDDYGESVDGIYDISGNNRHKVNDPIYSYDHSVDDTYDTSYQGRLNNPGDDTYNHMFGKQTEGDYDIAGS